MIQTLTFEMDDNTIKADFLESGGVEDCIGFENDIAVLKVEMFNNTLGVFVETEDIDIDEVIRWYESYKETRMTEEQLNMADDFIEGEEYYEYI
jgi:hypothetical protein